VTWNDGVLKVLAWDFKQPKQDKSNRSFYTKPLPAQPEGDVRLDLKHLAPGKYQVAIHRTGFDANDAYTAYLRMGSPASLSAAQVQQLQAVTTDRAEKRSLVVGANGSARLSVPMRSNDVVLVEIVRDR